VTTLDFRPVFESYELQQLDVPVEIYTRKMKIVARTTSSQKVTVEPGETYYVVAKLPAGRELIGYVEAEGEAKTVPLEPEPGDESPQEILEQTHYLTAPRETAMAGGSESVLETLGPDAGPATPAAVTVRRITGNPYAGEMQVEEETTVEPVEGETMAATAGPGVVLVQLLQEGFAPITMATPAAPGPSTTLKWVRHPAGHWSVDVHLANAVANLLVHYRAQGYARQAAETLESPSLNAEELLRGKMADPIAAAVGAYALLRFADLERLHDWTANLYDLFPEIPDAAAIRGEHLAREGNHSEALEVFLTLEQRGLPSFTDGLSFALERLRLYLESDEFPADARKRCEGVLELLRRVAPIVDFGKPVLTFTADPLDLLQPSGGPTPVGEPEPEVRVPAEASA
jgi:hypothetical protein